MTGSTISRHVRSWRWRLREYSLRTVALAGSLWLFLSTGSAQNLINSGQIDNSGTIRVKNQAVGLPSTVNGVFEFFGADQDIPARQYNTLALSGTGTKSTVGGSFGVTGNVTIAAPVILAVQSGEILTLGGTLNEQGYLRGSISKTVTLSGGTTASNFGQIGMEISWSGSAPGVTTVTRTSGVALQGGGNQSILRYYDVAPTFGSGGSGSILFRYDSRELNGHDSTSLELWRSTDEGLTWRRQGGVVDPVQRTITKSGVLSFSRWTAADTLHLLGPAAYEWVASALALNSGNSQQGPALSVLSPFVVTVSDFYGNPIRDVLVRFTIQSVPSGATGQSLSADTVRTNASGVASSVLTLGNVPGTYTVTASVTGLTGSPAVFTATAQSAASAMLLASGDAQVDTIGAVLSPMIVRLEDASGNPVSGIPVSFALTTAPAGQVGSALSDTSRLTDAQGLASTVLTLGNKVGSYTVRATTPVLPGQQLFLTALATNGVARTLALTSGNGQRDTIRAVLDTAFTVRITDAGANPVPGATVEFSIVAAPLGATGQTLSAFSVVTDAAGLASTTLTLGDKVGAYVVEARTSALPSQVASFTSVALSGAPALLAAAAGQGQAKAVATTLDTAFTVRIVDAGGNPIQGCHVSFNITSTPSGAFGQTLSTMFTHSDADGKASTVLTLGSKTGVYVVTAVCDTLHGLGIQFSARATAGAAAAMVAASGNGQTGAAGALLPQPFVVRVSDTFGNLVPGASVHFAITSSPAEAEGQALLPADVVTDTLGEARTVLLLGSYPGTYVVTASVTSVPAVQFTATGTIVLADVNRNDGVDIADLTSIIDHILGKIRLTGVDSMRADVNRDGAISVLDVQSLLNHLLNISRISPSISGPLAPGHQADRVDAVLRGLPAWAASDSLLAQLEVTRFGLRMNLTNLLPVKGIQLFLRLSSPESVTKAEAVFRRAGTMTVAANSENRDVYVVSYNLTNTPVEPGSGSLFRLPIVLQDTSGIDSAAVTVSVSDALFDAAIRIPVELKMALDLYPTTYRLEQNYPNPFNPNTTIRYEVPEVAGASPVVLVQVFNVLGEKVKTLARGPHDAGQYTVSWDGTSLEGVSVPSGVYFVRMWSQDFAATKKMVLVR